MIHAIFGEASVDEVIAFLEVRSAGQHYFLRRPTGRVTRKRLSMRKIPRFLLRERRLKQSGMINLCFRLLRMRKYDLCDIV